MAAFLLLLLCCFYHYGIFGFVVSLGIYNAFEWGTIFIIFSMTDLYVIVIGQKIVCGIKSDPTNVGHKGFCPGMHLGIPKKAMSLVQVS